MARVGGTPVADTNEAPPLPPPPTRPLGGAIMTDGAAEWIASTPEVAGALAASDPWPKIQPQPGFWLVYVTDRWDVIEGELVPLLYRLSITPGANGVSRGAGGRPDVADAVSSVERQGHFVLPWDIEGPGKPYTRSFQVGVAQDRKTGAPVSIVSWHTRWELLYSGSEYIQSDTAGYVAWLRGLIDAGKLPRPRPYVIERLIRFYEQRLHKQIVKDAAGDSSALTVDYKRRLGVCLKERERQRGTEKPAAPVEGVPADVDVPELATEPKAPRR